MRLVDGALVDGALVDGALVVVAGALVFAGVVPDAVGVGFAVAASGVAGALAVPAGVAAVGADGVATGVLLVGAWVSVTTLKVLSALAFCATPSTFPSVTRRNAGLAAGTMPRSRARRARGPGPETPSMVCRSASWLSARASERRWRSRMVYEPLAIAVLSTSTATKPPSSSATHSARNRPLPCPWGGATTLSWCGVVAARRGLVRGSGRAGASWLMRELRSG